jgi:hypothetical protein
MVHAGDRGVLERADPAARRRYAAPMVLEHDLGPAPGPDGHASAAAAPRRYPPIAAVALDLTRIDARDPARWRGAPVGRGCGHRPPEHRGTGRADAAPGLHRGVGGVAVRSSTQSSRRRASPTSVDRDGRPDVHRVLCDRRGTRTHRSRVEQGGRRRRQHLRRRGLRRRADRHRDRDPEVPALRHRHRDPQGVGVRFTCRVLHGGVRARRRRRGSGDGLGVDTDAVVRGRGARGDRIPACADTRPAVRGPGRVREAFDAVRSVGGARRAAW